MLFKPPENHRRSLPISPQGEPSGLSTGNTLQRGDASDARAAVSTPFDLGGCGFRTWMMRILHLRRGLIALPGLWASLE
jgi:hypothetical protein